MQAQFAVSEMIHCVVQSYKDGWAARLAEHNGKNVTNGCAVLGPKVMETIMQEVEDTATANLPRGTILHIMRQYGRDLGYQRARASFILS